MVMIQPPRVADRETVAALNGRTTVSAADSWNQIDVLLDEKSGIAPPVRQVAKPKRRDRWKGEAPSSEDAMQCGVPYSDSEMAIPRRDSFVPFRIRQRRRRMLLSTLGAIAVGTVVFVGWLSQPKGPATPTAQPSVISDPGAMTSSLSAPATPSSPSGPSDQKRSAAELGPTFNASSEPQGDVHFASHANEDAARNAPEKVIPAEHVVPVIPTAEESSAAAPAPIESTPKAPRKAVDQFGDLFGEQGNPVKKKTTDRTLSTSLTPAERTHPTNTSRPPRSQSLVPLELPPHLLALFGPPVAAIQSDALPRKPIDVPSRLNDPVAEISLNVGLNDLLKYISQVSTIPFTVRADSLRHSRLEPNVLTPVTAPPTTATQ